jgi:hypothetical protein
MRKFITTMPATTVQTAFTTAINTALTPLLPFKISLTNEEKKGMRSMAEGREGFARLIARIATQFPNSLSRADVPADLNNLLAFYDGVESMRMSLTQAMEVIEEIGLGTATDIMTVVDRYVNVLFFLHKRSWKRCTRKHTSNQVEPLCNRRISASWSF